MAMIGLLIAAWPFAFPALFVAGAAAVSVPILIHILNRRRFRVRDWAAMKFLLDSIRKNRRRLRIEEMILLAIRCLVVLLIGMTLARFSGCSGIERYVPGAKAYTVVFILDDSASMGQRYGADTMFKAAVADLSKEIDAIPGGNRVAVIVTSHPEQPFQQLGYLPESKDKNQLKARLAERAQSDTRSKLAQSLDAAGELLAKETGDKRVVILGDFRQADLAKPEQASGLHKAFGQLKDAQVDVTVLDYGRDAKTNLTIEDIHLADKLAIAGTAARIVMTVRNNGVDTASNVQVQLAWGTEVESGTAAARERTLPILTIDRIDAGGQRTLEFPFTPPGPGPIFIRASLAVGGDELAADSTASLALHVGKAMKVLIVDGLPDLTDKAQSESYFLAKALDPNGDGGYGVLVEVITLESISSAKFSDYDLVYLMNVASFPYQPTADGTGSYPQVAQLEDYVRNGGGLVIFTGDKIDPEFYGDRPGGQFRKDVLFNDANGLLPFPVAQKIQAAPEKFFRLDPKKFTADRMLRIFQGDGAGFTELIRFTAFDRAGESIKNPTAKGVKPPRVLARFNDDNNSVAIATKQFGEGNVLAFYTTGSARWNDWPRSEMDTFNVVMLDLLPIYARSQQSLTGEVGQELLYRLPPDLVDVTGTIKLPDYPRHDIQPVTPQDGKISWSQTDQAGVYTLRLGLRGSTSFSDVLFSRYVSPAEGDLRTAGKAMIAKAFGGDAFQYIKRGPDESRIESAGGHEYWQYVLAVLLGLVALEVFLGQRFGHYS